MDNKQENLDIINTEEPALAQNSTADRLKKQKRIILIVFLSLIGFVALYCAIYWISSLFPKYTVNEYDIYFYDEKYSTGDITKDETYMDKNRIINLKDENSGVTVSVTEEDRTSYNEAFNLLYSMVEYMIMGNVEAYNGCFSSEYFKTQAAEDYFTKQKIYDITIVEVSETEKTDENGNSYTEYYYRLEYAIRHNNGSLRSDVGSDSIKPQHVYLSDRSGTVLIDKLIVYTSVSKK